MTKYAKYISETQVQFPPKTKGDIINYDVNYELLIQDGYKEFIEVPRPDTNRMYHIEYAQGESTITEVIAYEETQKEADARELVNAKRDKQNEALYKANDFEQNGLVEHKNCVFEMSLSNRQNLKDTEEALIALGQETTYWNDKNDELVELTIEDISYIRLNLILASIRKLWLESYPGYLEAIQNATTKEEVEAIEINYTNEEN